MSNPWFRMYSEFATDPKVQSMSEAMQRRLMMLFCLRCSDVLATLQCDELMFALHISNDDLDETKALFIKKGFIDSDWNLTNWDKRQFNSDSSTERSRKHREAKQESMKVIATLCNVAATPPDTDTDTEEVSKDTLSPDKPDAIPPCPHVELIDLFAKQLPSLPQPKPEMWTGARAKALQARWRWVLKAKRRDGTRYAETRTAALGWFERFFGYVAQSDFLTGRDGKWTGCDLGWLVAETNFAKVVQGNYENKAHE